MSVVIQRSLAGGELSPAVSARADTVKFATGARTLRNMMVLRQGGASNRPGSYLVGEVKDSTKTVRLIPFVFNSSQTYMLEFGDLYMRVILNGVQQTLTAQAISAITNASTGVLTYVGADTYANGDQVVISGIVGPIGTYLNGRTFKVAGLNAGLNTFQLNYLDGTAVNTTAMGAYTSGGTIAEIYTVTTPWAEADLPTLQFTQSADVITVVHPTYAPREISRTAHTAWSLRTPDFAVGGTDGVSFSPGITSITGTAGANTYYYGITLVNEDTGEEAVGLTKASQGGLAAPTAAAPHTITVDVSGLAPWTITRLYQAEVASGEYFEYGLIGVISPGVSTFRNKGYSIDYTQHPFAPRDPFDVAGDFPAVAAHIQQRKLYAATNNDPENVWMSQLGRFKNFAVSFPTQQDDEAITFRMAGRQVNTIKHIIDAGRAVILTATGEWVALGDAGGVITPNDINLKQLSYFGASTLSPIVIGGKILFVQGRGGMVRDLFISEGDNFKGSDLGLFASHLFEGYTISDWAYQQIPNSIVWAVRSDGKLLGLTYLPEQEIWGWHRHDTAGTYENVCSIPEGTEDAVYVVVKRTIGSATKRYIERWESRFIGQVNDLDDLSDLILMDSALSFDGRNTGSTTMTLSGGTNWTYDETLTLTASAAFFASTDVGNQIWIDIVDTSATSPTYGQITDRVRCEIMSYTSTTVVSVHPHKTVPAALRSAAKTTWSRAVDDLTGLWHLEGKAVSVFADGYVVASPNNDDYDTLTVTTGQITLPEPHAVIQVGLPYISDVETLNIDTPDASLTGKKKLVSRVHLKVEKSRGIWVGCSPPTDDASDPLENLEEYFSRSAGEAYDTPPELITDDVDIDIRTEWSSNGRIFIRQVDPLPLTILSIAPEGLILEESG